MPDERQHDGPCRASANPARYDKLAVRRLARCIAELRAIHSEVPTQTIHVLLEVAIQPDITMGELVKKTRLSQASCSRNVALLSNREAEGDVKAGLGLVESEEDPVERRRKIVRLTPKGQELIALLADIVR